MTPDQVLQEEIIALEKRALPAEARPLLEEAAQLLAGGKEIEARALFEKAQAIAGHSKINGAPPVNGPAAADRSESAVASHIAARLAQSITSALTEALDDLRRDFGAQVNAVVASLEGRFAEMAAQLRAAEHAGAARATAAQEQIEQFSRGVTAELQAIATRVMAQEESLAALQDLVQDLSPKLAAALEQIDRHTDQLRSMHEQQVHRVAALNEVLDAIARLREPRAQANESGA